jgi:hypothetical protein
MRSSPTGLRDVVLLGCLAAYLGSCLFVFPAIPVLLGGDQAYFWMYADRMLRGERVYQDFFQFTPPGTDLVFLAAFALFGPRIWVTDAIVVALGVALGWVCFRVASRLMDRSLAVLATALFVVLVYAKALNATHHWFSVLAVMSAVAVLLPNSNRPRNAAAGALLGLGCFFTQTHGAVALLAFAGFAAWQARRQTRWRRFLLDRLAFLFAGFVLALLCTNAYFVIRVGVKQLWAFEVAYVWEHMGRDPVWPDLGLGQTPTWVNLPRLSPYLLVYGLLPTAFVLVTIHCWRKRREGGTEQRDNLALVSMVGVFLSAEVASNLNWLRLFAVAMPGVVLFTWALGKAGKLRVPFVRLTWVFVVCLGANHVRSRRQHNPFVVELPAGTAVTDSLHGEKLKWLMRRTSPGEFFFAADYPSYYLPLALRNPVFLDVVGASEETRPEYVKRAILELAVRRVDLVLWLPQWDDLEENRATSGLVGMRTFIHEDYFLAHAFSDGEQVWQRK